MDRTELAEEKPTADDEIAAMKLAVRRIYEERKAEDEWRTKEAARDIETFDQLFGQGMAIGLLCGSIGTIVLLLASGLLKWSDILALLPR